MKKKVLSLLVTFAMLFSMLPATALAAEPVASGDVIEVDASNAQDVLDGRYGDITGKTIHFTEDIDEVLDLARPTKYQGSGTVYECSNGNSHSDETKTFTDVTEFLAHYGENEWHSTPNYYRTLEDVTFTAAEDVTVAGFTFDAGHAYGECYDYVRDVEYTSGSAYYKYSSLKSIIFDGLTITGQFDVKLYLEGCTVEDITFEGCTFTGGTDVGNTAAIKFLADNQYFTNITVKDCEISNYYQGVYIQGVDGAEIVNNKISDTEHNAIALQSHTVAATGTIQVAENYITDVSNRAIRLNAVSSDAEISVNNNIMIDCGDSDGQLIKAGTVEEGAAIDLESNYWDGEDVSTAVSGLTAPSTVGITSWSNENVELEDDYIAEGYVLNSDGEIEFVDSIEIANVDELVEFQTSVNNGRTYEGVTVSLLSDIALTGEWTPIGNATIDSPSYEGNAFKGTFNGGGKTISGLTSSLFGVVDGATIENLKLDVSIAGTDDRVGAAVRMMVGDATVSDITVSGTVSGAKYVGGIVGAMTIEGTINDCINNATISGSTYNIGGIVGAAYYTAAGKTMTISGCTNNGVVRGPYAVGGIVGLSTADISDCTNTAAITASNMDIGGIVGEQKVAGSVIGCTNTGNVTNTGSGYGTGGIVGWIRYPGYPSDDYGFGEVIEVSGNKNSGNITGGNDAGGIVGVVYNAAEVISNENAADSIQAKTFAAGIVGSMQFTESVGEGIPQNTVNVKYNMSTTALDAITVEGACKHLYAYDNSSGGQDGTVVDNSNGWVAQIGDDKYAALAYAFTEAEDGDTVVVLADVELTETVTIPAGKVVTLNLNGKAVSMVYAENATANHEMIKNLGNLTIEDSESGGKLSYTYTGTNLGTSYAANTITTEPGSMLTVKSGTIENLTYDGATIAYAIDGRTNGGAGDVTVNIEGGTISSNRQAVRIFANSTTKTGTLNISEGTITGRVIVQNANANANKAALEITGGTFNGNAYKTDVLYVGGSNSATIDIDASVSGGTFNGEITETHVCDFISGGNFANDETKYCADGYICKENADDTYGVVIDSTQAIFEAAIENVGYVTLQAAIDAADEGDTITLLKDVTVSNGESGFVPVLNKNITLDGNDKTLSGSLAAYNAGVIIDGATDVTIKNLTIDLTTADRGVWVKNSTVSLILDGVKIVDCGTAIQVGIQTGNNNDGFDYEIYTNSTADLALTIKGTNGEDVFGATNGLVIRSGSSVTLTDDCDDTLNGLGYIPMYDNTKLIGNGTTTITGMSQINIRTGSAEIKNLKFDNITNGNNLSVITGSAAADDTITVSGSTFGNYDYDALQITPTADGATVIVEDNEFAGTSTKGKRAVHIEGSSVVDATVTVSGNKFVGGNEIGIEVSNFKDSSAVTISKNYFANETGVANASQIEVILVDSESESVNGCDKVTSFADESMTEIKVVAVTIVDESTAKYSTTLDEAAENADDGETIKLMSDVTVSSSVDLSGNVVDQNGKTITLSAGTTLKAKSALTVTAPDGYRVVERVSNGVYTYSLASVGGGGGGGGSASYTITVEDTKNGDITVSPSRASSGSTVTITVDPDAGYELDELVVLDKNGKEVELTKKSDTKYTFKMPSGKVTIEATFAEIGAEYENPFVDVSEGAYYYDAVLWAAENGITGGTTATTFSPAVTCTRAQTVTFLWRAAGSPEPETTVCPFEDVTSDKYYYDAVLWAVENGITVGTSATTFSPNATVTRAQNVTFLWRWAESPAVEAVNPFTDVAADKYYHDAVLWAADEGITAGTTATTFSPDDPCLRSQIVTFLYRYLAE